MKRVFAIAALGMFIAGVCTENVSAQLVRTEVHPIQTMTLTDQQFLTGSKDGKPTMRRLIYAQDDAPGNGPLRCEQPKLAITHYKRAPLRSRL